MPEMRAAKDKFFRGDELPTKTDAATPAAPAVSTPTLQPVSNPVKIWRH